MKPNALGRIGITLAAVFLAAARPSMAETMQVTVYVGNGMGDAAGLVLDTETLVLTEGETTGVFRSGTVTVTDSVTIIVGFMKSFDRDHIQVSYVDYYEDPQRSIERRESLYSDSLAEVLRRTKASSLARSFVQPAVAADFARPPAEARFAGMNESLIFLIFAAVFLSGGLLVLYERWNTAEALEKAVKRGEEELIGEKSSVLEEFCSRYPNDPRVRAASMELGRRCFDLHDFEKAAGFFEKAVRMDPQAKNPEAHFYLGHACRAQGYLCDAIDEWMACYLENPDGPLAREAYREAQKWRAYQIVRDKVPCHVCGAENGLQDLKCRACRAELKRTIVKCGVCGKEMIKEAQICIHCLPDDIKVEVAAGANWPVVKTTGLDWQAELIRARLEAENIPCVLTGDKNSAIPLTVGHLGQIDIRVPASNLADAKALID